ncbi:MAG: FAD-binding oxidoreductase [Pseudomonadota bacterium]
MNGRTNSAKRRQAQTTVASSLAYKLDLKRGKPAPGIVRPESLKELQAILHPDSHYPTPIRPMGANSSSTRCNSADGGTVIDTTGLKEIARVKDGMVTVEAGVTLQELARHLAASGLEVPGCVDLVRRTVGGAVAGGSLGATHDGSPASPFSHVVAMTVILPDGTTKRVTQEHPHLLNAFRLSYGVLGVIYDVTFRVRPITRFVIKHSKMNVEKFARVAAKMADQKVGLKFFFMPFKAAVYVELRRTPTDETPVRSLPWKLKDVGETALIPGFCDKLNRIVSIPSVRYGLADGLHGIGRAVLSNPLTSGGSSVAEHQAADSRFGAPELEYSTWCFPADSIAEVLAAYRAFASEYYKTHRYRCDMPVVGYRLPMNRAALLASNFDGPMFALRFVSSVQPMWEDFAMDLAAFASEYGGVPMFSQTRAAEQRHVEQAFGSRLEFFRKIRRRLDVDGRLLNPYLAQYLT